MSEDNKVYNISSDPEVDDRKAGVEVNIGTGAKQPVAPPPPPAAPRQQRAPLRPQAAPAPQKRQAAPAAPDNSDMLQLDMKKLKGFLKDNDYPEFKFLLLAAIVQTFCCCNGLSLTAGIVGIIYVIVVRMTHKKMSPQVWKIARIVSWVMVFGSLVISGVRFLLVPFKEMLTKLTGK